MSDSSSRSCEEVLNDFAVEEVADKATLTRYMRMYPAYAEDLVDLARELTRESNSIDRVLDESDENLVNEAWLQHKNAAPALVVNPLEQLSLSTRNEIVSALGIPRQVLAALRECRVLLSSIPTPFLIKLAEMVEINEHELRTALSSPPDLNSARSYKSNVAPGISSQITFEQLLGDAGVSEERRAELLGEHG